MKYLVRWEIDSDAATPLEAAREARAAQLEPRTTATIFDVYESAKCNPAYDPDFESTRIDLEALDSYKAGQLETLEAKCDCGNFLYGIVRVHHCNESATKPKAVFLCRGCGREESVCSANPCAGVVADREATV
jgi:hypothetical protein